jgi:hypothetical protein
MSNNFRKTFNIRNGVQVDQDNFIVNSNGLVGIGTSIPREFLDVVGNVQVSGLTTTGTLFAGTATADNLTSTNANITGVITATSISVGGVTFSSIVGYSTEAWIIDYADGSSDPQSGISTTLKVGIGTTQANNKYSLLIGGDPEVGEGITLNGPDGNINSSGIMTATSFYGSGANLTSLNASNISSGTIDNSYLPATISVTNVNATTFTGNLTGTASTATVASGLIDTPDINVGLLTATNIVGTSLSVGLITSTSSLHLTGTGSRIGIGTNSPTTDLQIRRSGNSVLEVVSDTDKAKIGLGNSIGIGNSSAEIRFHNKNLELYNYDTGNIDTIIHKGTGAGTTGNFRWVYGQDNSKLLTLTYDGNLGINESSPTHRLHVNGISTFTAAAHFDSDVTIDGTLNATITLPNILSNDLNSTGLSTFSAVEFTSKITTENGKIGIGTTNPIATGLDCLNKEALFQSVGVGTTNRRSSVDFGDAGSHQSSSAFMILPLISDSERSGLSTVAGAVIYNTDQNEIQFYNGTAWRSLDNSAV